MANNYKNLLITPNRSSSSDDPKITFSGANTTANTDITLRMYPTSNGTLSFEGSAGQLFSITNDLTGTIYSVNDVSGIPSIAVYANGQIDMARYSGNLYFGTTSSNSSSAFLYSNLRAGHSTLNSSPASTPFSHTLAAFGTNRVVNFDGVGASPSVWWTNGSRAYGAIDAQDPGLTIWSNNGSAWQQQMAINYGNVTINTDIRSPIFYDSNNTNYYVDPASTSVVSDFRLASGNIQTVVANVGQNLKLRALAGTSDIGVTFYDANDNWRMQLYASSGGYGFLDGNWAGWDLRKAPDGALYMNGNDSYYLRTDSDSYMYRVYGVADIRSPIFYDSNDTGYWIDPAASPSAYFANDIYIGKSSSDYVRINYDQIWRPNGGQLHLQYSAGGNIHMCQGGGYALSVTSFRSPIFYDNDDTGYYGNFAGTSSFNRIAVVRSDNNVYTDANYGYGLVGAYSASRYQGVFAMGDSYKLSADGTSVGTLYGIAWSHPNAGGAAANLASHGMLILENGTFKGAWGGGRIVTTSDVRGTLFYDYDNTGYYVDPNAGTSVNVAGAIQAGGNITAYYSDERLKTKLGYIDQPLNKLMSITAFYYEANQTAQKLGYKPKREVGLSAQEIQTILPEIVAPAPLDNNYLTIDYARVVPLLVEAIKELNQKHETEIAELKQALAALLNKQ